MIRFYMKGTVGAKDGTEISSNTLANPLIADGFYPASGVTVTKDIPVYIRADSGETWKDVIVGVISTTTDERAKFEVSPATVGSVVGKSILLFYSGGTTYTEKFPFFPELTDTNQSLILTVKASGDESNSPDTSQKLMVIGGVQV